MLYTNISQTPKNKISFCDILKRKRFIHDTYMYKYMFLKLKILDYKMYRLDNQ